jgi:hypothetical protein
VSIYRTFTPGTYTSPAKRTSTSWVTQYVDTGGSTLFGALPTLNSTGVPPNMFGTPSMPMVGRYSAPLNAIVLLARAGQLSAGPSQTWLYRYRAGAAPPATPPPDTTPPVLTLPSGLTVEATGASGSVVKYVASAADAVDGTRPVSCTPTSGSVFAIGQTTVSCWASDASGNVVKGTFAVIVRDTAIQTFAKRCAQPGVLRCMGFDSEAEVQGHIAAANNNRGPERPAIDTAVKASGAGSLRFTVPPLSGPDSSGAFFLSFPAIAVGDAPDRDVWVQWRQRFSPTFLAAKWAGGGGWKQFIVGEPDWPDGRLIGACTDNDLVITNPHYFGFPQMYHSCGAWKAAPNLSGQYIPLYEKVLLPGASYWTYKLQNLIDGCIYTKETVPPCIGFKPDQWMTFQVHVKVGRWYLNDGIFLNDSLIELWVAEEGKPSVPVIRIPWDLYGGAGQRGYGKVWLTPYNTGKSSTVVGPDGALTWVDDVIVSRQRIADPATESGTTVTASTVSAASGSVSISSTAVTTTAVTTAAPRGSIRTSSSPGSSTSTTATPSDTLSPSPGPAISKTTPRTPLPPDWRTTLVSALYSQLFGRAPTPQELASWTMFLAARPGTDTIRWAAGEFIASEEYLVRQTTFLDRALLGRLPSSDELEVSTRALADAVADKLVSVVTAQDSAGRLTTDGVAASRFVTALHHQALDRAADISEVAPWVDRLTSGDVAGVVKGILGSGDALDIPRSIAEYVTMVYAAASGIVPTTAELETWTTHIAAGLAGVGDRLMGTPEFEGRYAGAP